MAYLVEKKEAELELPKRKPQQDGDGRHVA
jgi:hypothetical protein